VELVSSARVSVLVLAQELVLATVMVWAQAPV
jgi:hypothetical protein